MSKKKWPLKYRFWRAVHCFFNRLAWKLVPDEKDNWLWKLNNWAGDHYILWWINEGRTL